MNVLETMADPRQTGKNKRLLRWVLAIIYTAVVIAVLIVFAFLTEPELFKPSEITITGTITASSISPEKITFTNITFTNTGCGTKNVASISPVGENSGAYSISLGNEYSYNVSIAWLSDEDTKNEADMGKLILDTFDKSITRDWTVQP